MCDHKKTCSKQCKDCHKTFKKRTRNIAFAVDMICTILDKKDIKVSNN